MNAFTPDEVVNLDTYQRQGHFHPFTCPNNDDGKHRNVGGDLGALVPTVRGWICPFCNYTQNWAHAYILKNETTRILAQRLKERASRTDLIFRDAPTKDGSRDD